MKREKIIIANNREAQILRLPKYWDLGCEVPDLASITNNH